MDQARAGLLEQRFEIDVLKARLVCLLRMTFGRSSEKLQTQLAKIDLTLADLDESLTTTLPPGEQGDEVAANGRKPGVSHKMGIDIR